MKFPEELLHFVWQFRLYDVAALQTTDGKTIQVMNCGFLNKHAGPDFTNAKIVVDGTTWAGHVEIHLKASDWYTHGHEKDAAYENVILHVVWENDVLVKRRDGTEIPTVSLKDQIPIHLFENYEILSTSINDFPCQQQFGAVDDFVISNFLSRVLVERLHEKVELVFERVNQLNGNWDEAFYHFLAANFGFKVNALSMQLLAQSLPQSILAKHKDQPLQIEALIFGQAGFLNQNFDDDYPNSLRNEYTFLRQKYQLTPIDLSLWKFLRMHPQNFPTIRLAQFAALIVTSNHLFSKLLSVKSVKELRTFFEDLPVNNFWQRHYHFNKVSAKEVSLQMGKNSIDNILINTVAQFLFAYGKFTDQHNFQTRAFYLLESIAAEQNQIIKQYTEAGYKPLTAYQTQALLQLRKRYCNAKKCLSCGIGLNILKKDL